MDEVEPGQRREEKRESASTWELNSATLDGSKFLLSQRAIGCRAQLLALHGPLSFIPSYIQVALAALGHIFAIYQIDMMREISMLIMFGSPLSVLQRRPVSPHRRRIVRRRCSDPAFLHLADDALQLRHDLSIIGRLRSSGLE